MSFRSPQKRKGWDGYDLRHLRQEPSLVVARGSSGTDGSRCGLKNQPYRRRRTCIGEDDNDRSENIGEDDADGAQDVPVHHPAVHRSPGLRAALLKTQWLYEHRQQQHKLGGNVASNKRGEEGVRGRGDRTPTI